MNGRYENTDGYDPEAWVRKVNMESDKSRTFWGPTRQLRSEPAAARRSPDTITSEQINQILKDESDRRWTEFHNRRLVQEQQEAANTLRGGTAEALIALCEATTTTATTIRAQARAETTAQLVIHKPQRLHAIAMENNL